MRVTYDMEMMRGDTLPFDIIVDGDIGVVTDITMTARQFFGGEELFHVDLNDGITPIEDGWHVRVPPSATEDSIPGAYLYDVQFTIDDDVYTPISGTLTIIGDATWRGEV